MNVASRKTQYGIVKNVCLEQFENKKIGIIFDIFTVKYGSGM